MQLCLWQQTFNEAELRLHLMLNQLEMPQMLRKVSSKTIKQLRIMISIEQSVQSKNDGLQWTSKLVGKTRHEQRFGPTRFTFLYMFNSFSMSR